MSIVAKKPRVLILFDALGEEGLPSTTTTAHVKECLTALGYSDLSGLQFNAATIYEDLRRINPDVVFNAMHGKYGEDGRVQGLLDIMKIPYTHDNHFVSAAGFNKHHTKAIMAAAGVPVAAGALLSRDEVLSGKYLQHSIAKGDYIVKPNCNGSTVGLCIRVGNGRDQKITESDLSGDDEFLLEEFVPGREFAVLCFNKKVVGAVELISKSSGEHNTISYSDKYIEACDRNKPEIEKEILDLLYDYSLALANAMNIKFLGRVDFRMSSDKIVALEVNTQPGCGKKSMVANICAYNGVDMHTIFEHLVLNAKYNDD